MTLQHDTQTKGFTLVELSIVLVIIGLLVGGTLVGQDLIRTASLGRAVSKVEEWQSATSLFKLKYGALPGDFENATAVFLATEWPDVANGDNDGFINVSTDFDGEIAQFWLQLSAARLIEGSFDTTARLDEGIMRSPLGNGGVIGIYDTAASNKNVFYFGITNSPNPGTDDTLTGQDTLYASEAYVLDDKLDDGHPAYGRVLSRGDGGVAGSFLDAPDAVDISYYLPEINLPIYAGIGWSLIVSPAYAVGTPSVGTPDTCIYYDGSLATAAEQSASAEYAITSAERACQLSIVIDES